jgi:NDP-sugar pyrophosphorylase family protein
MKEGVRGGIMAAGHGQRFRKAGFSLPKPMIEVGGIPLVGRSVASFRDAGITSITAVFNSSNVRQCSDYLLSGFPDMEFDIICRDTVTSAETFLTLAASVPDSRLVITTVDSIFAEDTFGSLVAFSSAMPPGAVCLGMSSYIDDERPLYISVDGTGRVTALGEKSDMVTCGVYALDSSVVRGYNHRDFMALRKLLGRFLEDGLLVTGLDMGRVIDVDRPEDLEEAGKIVV